MSINTNYEVVVHQIGGVWQASVIPKQSTQQTKELPSVSNACGQAEEEHSVVDASSCTGVEEEAAESHHEAAATDPHTTGQWEGALVEVKEEPTEEDAQTITSGDDKTLLSVSTTEFQDDEDIPDSNNGCQSDDGDRQLYLDECDGTLCVQNVTRMKLTGGAKNNVPPLPSVGSMLQCTDTASTLVSALDSPVMEFGQIMSRVKNIYMTRNAKSHALKLKEQDMACEAAQMRDEQTKKLTRIHLRNKSKKKSKDSHQGDQQKEGVEPRRPRNKQMARYRARHPGHQVQLLLSCDGCDTNYVLNIVSDSECGKTWLQNEGRTGPWIDCAQCKVDKPTRVVVSYPRLTGTKANRTLPKPMLVCMEKGCKGSGNTGVRFKNNLSFYTHYNSVHLINNLPCEFCGVSFKNKVRLRRHINSIHVSGEPTICPHCGKAFRNCYRLTAHIHKTHTMGNTECQICGEALHSSSMKKHMLTHIDKAKREQKTCAVCGKSFLSSGGLREHVLSHKRKHECRCCGKQLTTKAGLTYHENRCARKRGTVL